MRNALTLALKDARLAGRTRDTLLAAAFSAGLVLLVLGLGLGPVTLGSDPERQRLTAAGAVWTALALSAATLSGRAYAQELEAGAWEQLTLYPGPHAALYLGKWIGSFLQTLLLGLGVVPLSLILFGVLGVGQPPPWGALLLVTLLGTAGLSAACSFYAAVTVNLRAREALLPALAFPVLIPVVLATVKASGLLLTAGWTAEVSTWLLFLALFDASVVLVSALLFPFVLEN